MDLKKNTLTVVIPAYNEAAALPGTVTAVLEHCSRYGWKVIVVNDGSRDQTREVLEPFEGNASLRVLHHKVNRGYGGALKTGLMAVDTEYAVSFDADGQHRTEDIDTLFTELLQHNADMVVGSRDNTIHGNWYRELGKSIIRGIAGMLMPMPLKDLNSGFKLYRTSLLKQYLPLCPDSMAFSDIITLIFLSERNLVIETPIHVAPRSSGASTISTYTAFETVMEILNLVMVLSPLRFFLPLSFSCLVIGLGWGIPFILMGRGVSVGAMLAIVSALILFTIGLVTEQLSHLRKDIILNRKRDS